MLACTAKKLSYNLNTHTYTHIHVHTSVLSVPQENSKDWVTQKSERSVFYYAHSEHIQSGSYSQCDWTAAWMIWSIFVFSKVVWSTWLPSRGLRGFTFLPLSSFKILRLLLLWCFWNLLVSRVYIGGRGKDTFYKVCSLDKLISYRRHAGIGGLCGFVEMMY